MLLSQEELKEFVTEANELLDQAEKHLLELDKNSEFKSLYDSIFRVFHSLKGGAGMLGYEELQTHMHSLENSWSALKSRDKLTTEEISYFLSGTDAGRSILQGKKISFEYNITNHSPAQKAKVNVQTESEKKVPLSSIGKVYLVDDEQHIVDYFIDVFSENNINNKGFTEAKKLLEECKLAPPDVIFTDIKMPEMDGIQLLTEIRKFNADVPIVIISAHVTTEALLKAIDAGVFFVLEKPVKENQLLSIAHAAIKFSRASKILRKSLNLLMYQFSDFENFLRAQGKEDIVKSIKYDINQIMTQLKELSSAKVK